MNNRDVAIDIYNRLNRWSHGVLTDFAVGIIEDELDMAFPEGAKNTEQPNKQKEKKRGMTDTERLNKLESFMRKSSSNGIAMMPLNGGRLFSIDDLAHEDGSNLGEELCLGKSLREVIDNLTQHAASQVKS